MKSLGTVISKMQAQGLLMHEGERPQPTMEWDTALERFVMVAARIAPNYVIDDENSPQIHTCIAWAIRHERFYQSKAIQDGHSLNKGLCLIGRIGSGKSLLMRILSECRYPDRAFGIVSTRAIVDAYDTDGPGATRRWGMKASEYRHDKWVNQHMCLDDLGFEEQGHYYGKRTEVLTGTINDRYDHRIHGLVTHITTNLSLRAIRERYGDRVESRINELCNIIYLGHGDQWTDRRKPKA